MKFSLLVCLLLLLGLGCTQTAPPEPSGKAPAATPSTTTQIEEGELFSIGDFILTLPEDWTYKSFDRDGRTTINTISVPDDPWETALVIYVEPPSSREEEYSNPQWEVNGVRRYDLDCRAPVDCFTLQYSEKYYDVTIGIESNEPAPTKEGADWFPGIGAFTLDEIDAMFQTIQPVR